MAAKTFVDTNILVYAHDRSAGTKHEVAQQRLEELWAAGCGVVSTQVLQELYTIVTRKVASPLPIAEARQLVNDYLVWECIVNGPEAIVGAFDYESRYLISFWDSLIVHAANVSEAGVLLSEDLNSGQRYGNVLVENPFD
ncbi:MAG: PIN domain-containing protein [Gammaproteobacteria bacterium]|nr:PIN domain-containing protein [Gammaproteobacteria bacterium]MDE0365705.1 PIN domain-containing protein [Gammaproteobacteria bacterium]